MKNKRLMKITEKAVGMGLEGGKYLMDGLNQIVITDDICFTVITRTFLDNNHFLLEIYEGRDQDTTGDE